eukprot:12933842-Prorocentrum_lima.AAC.1
MAGANRLNLSTIENDTNEETFMKVEGLTGDDQTLEISPGPDIYYVVNDSVMQVAVASLEIAVVSTRVAVTTRFKSHLYKT